MAVDFHPDAGREVDNAVIWYLDADASAAASGFLDELNHAITEIEEHPERYPKYLHGTHRFVLNRYPYSVVYRILKDRIVVIAVAAWKKGPGYWRRRRP